MENDIEKVAIGVKPNNANSFLNADVAGGPLGPFFTQTELSADAVRQLYMVGRKALAA